MMRLLRAIRRTFFGLNPYFCACGHHRCYHDGNLGSYCHRGFCSCSRFYPETTVRSMATLKKMIESGADMTEARRAGDGY